MPIADDYRRPVLLDITADGTIFVREAGQPRHEAALPFFSTFTRDEAEQLVVLHCRRARDGSGSYRLNTPPSGYEDLDRITDMFRKSYFAMRERNGQ